MTAFDYELPTGLMHAVLTLADTFCLETKAIPNLTRTWVAFDYKLTPGETNAFIEIVSSNGQKINTLQLRGNRGQKVLDTRRFSPGIYVYTLVCNNLRKTGKLIVN